MSYKTVVSITITFTIAKKNEKPFFSKDMKYQNGRFSKECFTMRYASILIEILFNWHSATSKFMT
jgi:hypothetical protein